MAASGEQKLTDCSSDMCVSVNTYTFTWTLGNVHLETSVRNLTFQTAPNIDWEATFERTPGSFYLFLKKTSGPNVQVKHDISILDKNRKQLYTDSSFNDYSSEGRFDLLKNLKVIPECLTQSPDDILVLHFKMELKITDVRKVMNEVRNKMAIEKNNCEILLKDLSTMYETHIQSDITLQVGETAVPAHKVILAARSPVFAKMFQTAMKENVVSVVDIEDFDLSVVKNFVAFLYTGSLIDEDFEAVYSLYHVADKYDVASLRKTCAGVLLANLSVENICRLMTLADLHNDTEFKESTMSFMAGHFDKVANTTTWENFVVDNTKLAAEIVIASSKNQCRSPDSELSTKCRLQ